MAADLDVVGFRLDGDEIEQIEQLHLA
jgi:hypothetical protein